MYEHAGEAERRRSEALPDVAASRPTALDRGRPDAAALLRLQATAGNQAVGALLGRRAAGAAARGPLIQRLVEKGARVHSTRVKVIDSGETGLIVGATEYGYFVDVGDGATTPSYYEFDELEPVTELGETAFRRQPELFEPVMRRGHNFPERQALPGDMTVLMLLRNHSKLILRQDLDAATAADLNDHLFRLMTLLQMYNEGSVPQMLNGIKLARDYLELKNELIQARAEEDETDAMKELRRQLAGIAQQVDSTLDRRELQEAKSALGAVVAGIFWLNSGPRGTLENPRRAPQLATRARLLSETDGPFSGAFVPYAKEDEAAPHWTAGHTEQTLIVSDQWAALRVTLHALLVEHRPAIGALKTAWAAQLAATPEETPEESDARVQATSRHYERLERLLGSVTISLNRSPCPICTQFLIAEMINFWEQAALDLELPGGWREARGLLADLLRFELSYSIVYTDSLRHIEAFNGLLRLAGWHVFQHEQYVKEPDEVRFTTTQSQYSRPVREILSKRAKARHRRREQPYDPDRRPKGIGGKRARRRKDDSEDEFVPKDDEFDPDDE